MRLTLRTLLAYLDDILDENDAHELQKKIDESEKATQLVHRIRQIVGQTRLDSPPLDAEGLSADANSVSEYLDNTLPADDVPEFERRCLDSDVQLGEVAACHQILTIVLGESATITSRLKNHVYRIGDGTLDEHVSAIETGVDGETARIDIPAETVDDSESIDDEPAVVTESVASIAHDSDEHWTTAPDYLKRPQRTLWKPVGIAALIAFCLVFAGIRGMGPLDATHPIATWFRGAELATLDDSTTETPEVVIPPAPANDVEAASSQDLGSDVTAPPAPQEAATSDDVDDGSPFDPRIGEGSEELLPQPPETSVVIDEPPVTDEPPASIDSSDDAQMSEIPLAGPNGDASTADDITSATPELDLPSVDLPEVEADPIVPPEPNDVDIIDLGPDVDDVAISVPNPNALADAATGVDTSTDATEPREVGKFLSEDQLLVRYNPLSEFWDRISARESVREDELLMSFPIFRPQLMLATGMQLTLVGPTRLRVLPLTDDSPNIQMEFGRATVETFAQAGSTIGINWTTHAAIATLEDMDSSFAIEIKRQFIPGTNVELDEAHVVFHLYTISGSVDWQTDDNEPIAVAAGQRLTIVDSSPGRLAGEEELPAWIDGKDGRPRDPSAMRLLLPKVTEDRPVSLSLKEQAETSRLEVRSLAVCSLAYLGEFDPLLVALSDGRLKSYWTDEYRALTEAMVVSPEAAKQVRRALETKHGAEGGDLFRLLWGYDSEQLRDGGAQGLVSYLDHPASDFRVAAHENLKTITGTPSLYMPHYGEKLRKPRVFKWKDKLSKGQIVYREPPAITVLLDGETTDE